MNSLMPLLTVSVIAGFWSCAMSGVHRVAGGDKVLDRALDRDEVKSGLAAVDGVEVAADDQWFAVPAGPGGGLGVSDDAVVVDRLSEEVGIAFGVGGELADLLGGDLGGVHAGDPLLVAELDTSCRAAGACS